MGFIVPVVVVAIDVVIVACSNRHSDGILTEAGFNKTKQRDPSQRSSQRESNFRRHAGDANGLFRVTQAFLLQFCNLAWRGETGSKVSAFGCWTLIVWCYRFD